MKNINEILLTIVESKPLFLDGLNLEGIIQSIMIDLVTCEDNDLIEEYLNLLENVCYIEKSKYASLFENSIMMLFQIIRI